MEENTPSRKSWKDMFKSGEKESRTTVRKLFSFADGLDIFLMIGGMISAAIFGASNAAFAYIWGGVLDAFNKPREDVEDAIAVWCLRIVFVGIGAWLFNYLERSLWGMSIERQMKKLRSKYLEALLKQEIGWFDAVGTGAIVNNISSNTITIQQGIGEKFVMMIEFFSAAICGIIVGFIRGWKLTLVILAIAPVIAVCSAFTMKVIESLSAGGNKAYREAGNIAQEVVSSIRTVASFCGEEKECKKYSNTLSAAKKAGVKKAFVSGFGLGLNQFCWFGSNAIILYYGAVLVANEVGYLDVIPNQQDYTGGDVVAVLLAVSIGAMILGQAGPCMEALGQAQGAAHAIFETLQRKPMVDSTKGKKLDQLQGNLRLKNIHFRYPSRPDASVLKGLNLKIKAGQKVALVGQSGCGKSSVVGLLQRFYEPTEGTIRVDRKKLTKLNLKWWRQHIGYVGQEPVLFSATVAENIAYGKEGATMEDIMEAAKSANAHKFITEFPDGYNTQVGEKGAQLSGGQKQRIAIARAIIKNPKILLLDEATSALDTESEKVVQDALDSVMKGRTTIVIAHRLSTIRDADMIAVIHDGKVAELGNHEKLLEKNGIYAELVHIQSSGGHKEKTKSESHLMEPNTNLSKEKSEKKITEEEVEKDTGEVDASLTRLAKFNKPELPLLGFGTIAAILSGGCSVMISILFSYVLEVYYQPKDTVKKDIIIWTVYFFIIGVTLLVSCTLQYGLFGISGQRLILRLRELTFSSILKHDMGWFDDPVHSTSNLTTHLASDTTFVEGMLGSRLSLTTQNLAVVVVGLTLALSYGWKLTLVLLATAPLLVGASAVQMVALTGFSSRTQAAVLDANQIATESIGNIRTVAAFATEDRILTQYSHKLEAPFKMGLQVAQVSAALMGLGQLTIFCVLALAFWYGSKLIASGEQSFLDVMNVTLAIMFSATTFGQNAAMYPDAAKGKAATRAIFQILDSKPAIDSSSKEGTIVEPSQVQGDIQFCQLGFRYPTRPDSQVLKGLSLSVQAGQVVALVGPSGCGKSSLIALLERFYDPQEGKILLDGTDIKNIQVKSLRSLIGVVGQEPILFSATVAENIAYGKEGATMEEIIEAAKSANAHKFITEFPDGYNTQVGEKGAQLSGGQKQRIAIARAIIKNPKILLLDEATSALDTESEKVVQDALDSVMKGRTTIVIAHRLSTIRDADMIAVIHDGKVAELGNHEKLVELGGIYSSLVQRQAS